MTTKELLETKVNSINCKVGREYIKLSYKEGCYGLGIIHNLGVHTLVQGYTAKEVCSTLDTLYNAIG